MKLPCRKGSPTTYILESENTRANLLSSRGLNLRYHLGNFGIQAVFGLLFQLLEVGFKVLFLPFGGRRPGGFGGQGSLAHDAEAVRFLKR